MKILFTSDRIVDNARKGTPKELRFEAGKVYDLAPASVKRWLRRGAGTTDPEKISAVDGQYPAAKSAVVIPTDWVKLKTADLVALASSLTGRKIGKGADAANVIASALIDRAQSIEFRIDRDGDALSFVALNPFPEYALVDSETMAALADVSKIEGSTVTLSFANGGAKYVLAAQRDGLQVLQLIDERFEKPASVPKNSE